MTIVQHINGKSIKFKNRFFVLELSKTYNIYNEDRKNLLFQFNRFENGFCTLYLRLFKYYSLSISDIKLKEGKRIFIGNKEN